MRSFVQSLAVSLLVASLAAPVLAENVWDRRQPYGREMMSKAERKAYWREFLALETDEERQAYWDAHVVRMQALALERGVSSSEPPKVLTQEERFLGFWRMPYFTDIMTPEERANYRSDLDGIPDRDDRRRYVADHIRRMQARADERGVSAPSAKDFDDVFDGLEEAEAAEADDSMSTGEDSEEPDVDGEFDPEAEDSP